MVKMTTITMEIAMEKFKKHFESFKEMVHENKELYDLIVVLVTVLFSVFTGVFLFMIFVSKTLVFFAGFGLVSVTLMFIVFIMCLLSLFKFLCNLE